MTHQLERQVFVTSRLLDFFSEKELRMQIGHSREWWPIALVKELIDNSLDACESADITPYINVDVEDDVVLVQDNGPGLPESTLRQSTDYHLRVSDKNHYIAPTRGQLGNALKCVWAAPFVASEQRHGCVDVYTPGKHYTVQASIDRIASEPRVTLSEEPSDFVKNGTILAMHFPSVAGYLDGTREQFFYNPRLVLDTLLARYALFNPHTTICRAVVEAWRPTDTEWRKWKPSDPTSAHWYSVEQLRTLIAANLRAGNERTVREFVSEFRGLSGSAKQKKVTEQAGLARATLADLVDGDDLDRAAVSRLLAAMREHSRPVNPKQLGEIGEGHMTQWLGKVGAAANTVNYRIKRGECDGLPYVLEVAFGVRESSDYGREVAAGVNWSPALRAPIAELDEALGECRVDDDDPVILALHLILPRVEYTDAGKSRLALPEAIHDDLDAMIKAVTAQWQQVKRKADRDNRVRERDLEEMRKKERSRELSIKEACYQVMVEAYMEASTNNTLPANARQVMYSARRRVLRLAGQFYKNSSSFTQDILPTFIDEHPALTADWDVVYDDRGHFIEPHTRREIGIGTLNVRRYVAGWTNGHLGPMFMPNLRMNTSTSGPDNRFQNVLFVEKEGFNSLLKDARIAERFDLAIMSTKGQTVTSARRLAEDLTRAGVRIFVLHDFDKSGFEILNAYKNDTRRYQYDVEPDIIDIGLRLRDVIDLDLADDAEDVSYPSKVDPRENLVACGATPEECDFLVQGRERWGKWYGKRVELNALPSGLFIEFLKRKLREHGVEKVVPNTELLTEAYEADYRFALMQGELQKVYNKYRRWEVPIPDHLRAAVSDALADSSQPWDDVVAEMARDAASENKPSHK